MRVNEVEIKEKWRRPSELRRNAALFGAGVGLAVAGIIQPAGAVALAWAAAGLAGVSMASAGLAGYMAALAMPRADAMPPLIREWDGIGEARLTWHEGNMIMYGKVVLNGRQMRQLKRMVAHGEYISQRALSDWHVVADRASQKSRDLMDDIERMGFGEPAGNGRLLPTRRFRRYFDDNSA